MYHFNLYKYSPYAFAIVSCFIAFLITTHIKIKEALLNITFNDERLFFILYKIRTPQFGYMPQL